MAAGRSGLDAAEVVDRVTPMLVRHAEGMASLAKIESITPLAGSSKWVAVRSRRKLATDPGEIKKGANHGHPAAGE